MTAASPACSSASSHSTQSSSPGCLPACRGHLRKDKVPRSGLHLHSAPGVWLLLGAAVVLVGTGVAVAGYVSAAPKPAGVRGSSHVERMKLAGPVVMGVGLFIFICAATLLYENRDSELLRQESLDDLEDLRGGDGWEEESQEQRSFSCQQQREGRDGEQGCRATQDDTLPPNQDCGPLPPPPPPPRRPNIGSTSSLPGDRGNGDREEREEEREGRSTLLARVLHHQEPTPPPPPSPCPSTSPSSVHSDSCNSSEIDVNMRTDSALPSRRPSAASSTSSVS